MASAPALAFPASDVPGSSAASQQHPPSSPGDWKRPHLPFRRISLPSPPPLILRQSVVSVTSTDTALDANASVGSLANYNRDPFVTPLSSPAKKSRPLSVENGRKRLSKRHSNLRDPLPAKVDEAKQNKRWKVINEIYDTEKAYVEGLDLIYSHFLAPIIQSLDTPQPLLDRDELTSLFSNFIDVWNLHHSFFNLLTTLLPSSSSSSSPPSIPPLSAVLNSHFPYLSMYKPFVTSFPTIISSLTSLANDHPAFAAFIKQQETDPRCGKLKLVDWLLTIVQRCPRYLLLLKDLIDSTNQDDDEYVPLVRVYDLLSKITNSLNTSLHTHSQTMSLLDLQRNTANLPLQLVQPGRFLLKRGPLVQLDNSSAPKQREFLLFTDCVLWLADESMENDAQLNERFFQDVGNNWKRLGMKRTRSKSENELPLLRSSFWSPKQASPKKASKQAGKAGEKWLYKGKVDLVDAEVLLSPVEEKRLELMCPDMSFALYAGSEEERDEWVSALRGAKASQLVSLNITHPNSTLTSSTSNAHLRKALQALPYSPDEEESMLGPKRSMVEHFVPAIWIPDGKTTVCMRCGHSFGWRRRRHHCRLCGRCVCASCSNKTFFIHDPTGKNTNKSARACNACYDAVFPLISEDPQEEMQESNSGSTITTLPPSHVPDSLLLPSSPIREASALMSIRHFKKRPSDGGSHDGDEVRKRKNSRPLSYPSIPLEFQLNKLDSSTSAIPEHRSTSSPPEAVEDSVFLSLDSPPQSPSMSEPMTPTHASPPFTPRRDLSPPPPPSAFPSSLSPEEGDRIARNRKRFSLPAVSVQTTPVTARASASGLGKSKRFSLVLAVTGKGKNNTSQVQRTPSSVDIPSSQTLEQSRTSLDLREGAAVTKLNELLGRRGRASDDERTSDD